ncbi:hypothetical protein CVU37_09160 [candidate division BRC1 bacterium HGW-BRC1-1]|jgi:phage host-nuclease inhibitor protein Gam|nr:MAG: hypothetical protein CVU37_09160 [candidate division BRC1 bacterium HGW-BRC1-1]
MATKTARQRISVVTTLRNLEEANEALRELCMIIARRQKAEGVLNAKITQLRDKYDTDAAPDNVRDAQIRAQVEEYFTVNKDEYFTETKRSLPLTFAQVDFRYHPPSVAVKKTGKWTVAKVITAIKETFVDRIDVWIRQKEELNKDALVTANPDELAQVGLEIIRKESFGITPFLEELERQGA